MKKNIFTLSFFATLFLASCNEMETSKKTEILHENKVSTISYTEAKNYFVKNTVDKLENPKIETEEKFHEFFGMATTMSKDGQPTNIDFNKQFVIAVLLPETDLTTTISPVSLQKDENGKLLLTYKIVTGEKQSYTTKPHFEIIVDKKDNGNVELKEQK